ncbi:MAG: Fur family transcriptional regulator [Lachnospiraceae bacterium]
MNETKGYKTKSKTKIMEYLVSHSEQRVSAADIIRYLRDNGSRVNPATIYRNLDKMTENGEILKYKTANTDCAVYQCVKNHNNCINHLHLQCENCGKIIHLECGFMDIISSHLLADHGFSLKCSGSVLLGTCKECSLGH